MRLSRLVLVDLSHFVVGGRVFITAPLDADVPLQEAAKSC